VLLYFFLLIGIFMFNSNNSATLLVATFLLLLSSIVFSLYYREKLELVQTEDRERRRSTLLLAGKVTLLARDIRIATSPAACDALTKEIVGDSCDIGNYMEWAGPHLEKESRRLHQLLSDSEH
jgi:hypothetical protein